MISLANNASLYCEWTTAWPAYKVGIQIGSQNADRRIMFMCELPAHGGNGFYTVQYARIHQILVFIAHASMSANAQSFQSVYCFHTQMRDVDECLDQYFCI